MNNYYFIYLECEKYLAEYILQHFGVSAQIDGDLFDSATKYVEFSNTSPEQKILYRFLSKPPKNSEANLPSDTSIAIKLPMRKEKHPRDGYTYLSDAAKRCLIDHLIAILDAELIKDYLEALRDSPNMNITNYTCAWCEENGIDTDDGKSPETIRQKIYRFRKNWKEENTINLV